MKFINLKNSFLPMEPKIAEYPMDNLLTGTFIRNIHIKLNFNSIQKYPFTVSPQFLEFTIYKLIKEFKISEIFVTDIVSPEEENNAKRILPSIANFYNSSGDLNIFAQGDLKISLSTVIFNYHHLERAIYSAIQNMQPFDHIISKDKVYCILDSRIIGISNEHLYFNTGKKSSKILTGWNPSLMDSEARLLF